MVRILLLRHARAGWAAPGMRDYDRPLEDSGRIDARAIGQAMRHRGYSPAKTICSGAMRARETLVGLTGSLELRDISYSDGLYETDANGYLAMIRSAGDVESVLLVGHNPMMEDTGLALSGNGEADALELLSGGFPTAGLAVIRMDSPLAHAELGKGYLEDFLTPANIAD